MTFMKKMYWLAFMANVILLTTKNDVKVKAHYSDPHWGHIIPLFRGVHV
jgi:hypothetical protein